MITSNKFLCFQELKGKREIECESMDGNIEKKYTERKCRNTKKQRKRMAKKERARPSKQRRDRKEG